MADSQAHRHSHLHQNQHHHGGHLTDSPAECSNVQHHSPHTLHSHKEHERPMEKSHNLNTANHHHHHRSSRKSYTHSSSTNSSLRSRSSSSRSSSCNSSSSSSGSSSSTTTTSSNTNSSCSSSSNSSSSSESSFSWSSASSLENAKPSSKSSRRSRRLHHSQSCTEISRGRRAFEVDVGEDTMPLLDEDGNGRKSASMKMYLSTHKKGKGPEKGPESSHRSSRKNNPQDKKTGNFRRVKSMEVLHRQNDQSGEGELDEKEVERRKDLARKNLVKEKIKFSAFLNEITRQVLSPSRLHTLGVTDVHRSPSPVVSPVKSQNSEHNRRKKRKRSSRCSGSASSVTSSIPSCSSKRSHSNRRTSPHSHSMKSHSSEHQVYQHHHSHHQHKYARRNPKHVHRNASSLPTNNTGSLKIHCSRSLDDQRRHKRHQDQYSSHLTDGTRMERETTKPRHHSCSSVYHRHGHQEQYYGDKHCKSLSPLPHHHSPSRHHHHHRAHQRTSHHHHSHHYHSPSHPHHDDHRKTHHHSHSEIHIPREGEDHSTALDQDSPQLETHNHSRSESLHLHLPSPLYQDHGDQIKPRTDNVVNSQSESHRHQSDNQKTSPQKRSQHAKPEDHDQLEHYHSPLHHHHHGDQTNLTQNSLHEHYTLPPVSHHHHGAQTSPSHQHHHHHHAHQESPSPPHHHHHHEAQTRSSQDSYHSHHSLSPSHQHSHQVVQTSPSQQLYSYHDHQDSPSPSHHLQEGQTGHDFPSLSHHLCEGQTDPSLDCHSHHDHHDSPSSSQLHHHHEAQTSPSLDQHSYHAQNKSPATPHHHHHHEAQTIPSHQRHSNHDHHKSSHHHHHNEAQTSPYHQCHSHHSHHDSLFQSHHHHETQTSPSHQHHSHHDHHKSSSPSHHNHRNEAQTRPSPQRHSHHDSHQISPSLDPHINHDCQDSQDLHLHHHYEAQTNPSQDSHLDHQGSFSPSHHHRHHGAQRSPSHQHKPHQERSHLEPHVKSPYSETQILHSHIHSGSPSSDRYHQHSSNLDQHHHSYRHRSYSGEPKIPTPFESSHYHSSHHSRNRPHSEGDYHHSHPDYHLKTTHRHNLHPQDHQYDFNSESDLQPQNVSDHIQQCNAPESQIISHSAEFQPHLKHPKSPYNLSLGSPYYRSEHPESHQHSHSEPKKHVIHQHEPQEFLHHSHSESRHYSNPESHHQNSRDSYPQYGPASYQHSPTESYLKSHHTHSQPLHNSHVKPHHESLESSHHAHSKEHHHHGDHPSPLRHSPVGQLSTSPCSTKSDSSSNPSPVSHDDQSVMTYKEMGVSFKDKGPEFERIIMLQEQNKDLHKTLRQTVVRMECLGAKFITEHHQLESELQRTRVELTSMMDNFTRLQTNYSPTQQTESQSRCVNEHIQEERERLNQRISELTKQLAAAKSTIQSLETINETSMLEDVLSKRFKSDQPIKPFRPPVALPPVQFMDSEHYNKGLVAEDEQLLGPVPEEEESDWSDMGEERKNFACGSKEVAHGHGKGLSLGQWVRADQFRRGDGDTESESEDEVMGRDYDLKIPRLQFTLHPETITITCLKQHSDGSAEDRYHMPPGRHLGSTTRIISASREGIDSTGLQQLENSEKPKSTEGLMDPYNTKGKRAELWNENELISSWTKANDGEAGFKTDGEDPFGSMANLETAQMMLNHFIHEGERKQV